jgi:hypothetical protein
MTALSRTTQRRVFSTAAGTALHFYTNRQLELYAARKTNKLSLRQLVGEVFEPPVLVFMDGFSGVLRPSDERGASHQGRGKFACFLVPLLIAIL